MSLDRFITGFPGKIDDDLVICKSNGVAYQADRNFRADVPYYDKCMGYAGGDIANKINAGRRDFVNRFVGDSFPVLDVGVGSGEFIQWRAHTMGYDVDAKAVAWLKSSGKWSDEFGKFRAFTFWDVIEHVETPEDYFKHMVAGSRVFVCLPIFDDLLRIRESRHYRPGEHLYYFTGPGFINWMAMHRFALIGRSTHECAAGRDSVLTFAFERQPGTKD